MAGFKFRRQHTIELFVVDFYCHEAGLAIELDGDSPIGRANYDAERTMALERWAVRVLRIGNDDLLRDCEAVLEMILRACGGDAD